ncbi:MAG TPA: DUF2252 family protein [Polyangiaceae bacterium]|jgi:uncharacterized protein (DUF2252 family)
MFAVDPVRLARRQLDIDRDRTSRFSHLMDRKVARMVTSPLAFLRGSAPLFYELLDRHPGLAEGPAGRGWLVGDAHVENFGAFRAGTLSVHDAKRAGGGDRVVFDLNDFDEAFVGDWRLDVLRLVTSVLLGGREMGADGSTAVGLADALIGAYIASLFRAKRPRAIPRPVQQLVERVQARTRRELLDRRTLVTHQGRQFVRDDRYETLSPKLRAKAERAFEKYAKRLDEGERPPGPALRVLDAAFRVAGTGSLGCLRVAVLVEGKGGDDGSWVFDMKEEGAPSASSVARAPDLSPADRVTTAIRACLAQPPRMIGASRLRGSSMFVRRLTPQEDKLDLLSLRPEDLEPLARHLGVLLGAAHRRGATRMPKKAWTAGDAALLRAHAISLAGIHEATYLAYCDLARR